MGMVFSRRRFTVWFLIVVLAAVVWACGKTDRNGTENVTPTGPEEKSRRAFFDESGAMYTEAYVFYTSAGFVRYFDTATQKGMIYCFAPECEHAPAYLDAVTGKVVYTCPANGVCEFGGYLSEMGVYYISDSVIPTLIHADSELKNRKEVSRADMPCGSILSMLYTDTDYYEAYMDTCQYIRQESESGEVEWLIGDRLEEPVVGVYRMSLDGKKQTPVFESAGNYNEVILGLYEYGGHLYFTYWYLDVPSSDLLPLLDDYPQYEKALAEHGHSRVYDYDEAKDTLKVVLSEDNRSANYSFFDGYILRRTSKDGPAVLYRLNGDVVRELEGNILDGVRNDGRVILHYMEDEKQVYRLYDPERDVFLREISLPNNSLLEYAVGKSYYVYVPKNEGTQVTMAYISEEDFWNGAIDKAVVLPTGDSS